MELAPCPSCKRHVRLGVVSCPFCASALPALRARTFIPRAITRAAIFSAALAGCQDKKSTPAPAAGSAMGSALGSAAAVVPDDAPPPVADTAVSTADDAAVADAGTESGSAAAMEKAKAQKIRLEKDKKDADFLKQRQHMAKPYGAPPARRRIV